MNSNQKLHQAKLNQWAARITDQKSSGLTVREWCLQTGVTIHAYNYWKHLLKEDLVEQVLPDIAPLTPPDRMALPAQSRISFSMPGVTDRAGRANCSIYATARLVIGDVAIEVTENTPESLLLSLIRVARHA